MDKLIKTSGIIINTLLFLLLFPFVILFKTISKPSESHAHT